MSTSLASTRHRRAAPEQVAPARQTIPQPSFPGQQQANMGPGLTLPQVIALVDKRLNSLEVFMQTQTHTQSIQPEIREESNEAVNQIAALTEEYNARFDIIADELALLKDTVLKLQTYTMDVNKTLMEDRIRILSDEPNSRSIEEQLNAV